MGTKWVAMAALAALVLGVPATAATVVWDRTPIGVVLHVGYEQQVRFPGPVSVGAPEDLVQGGLLRTLVVGDTVYWQAWATFEKRRLRVRLLETGEFVLVDVEGVEGHVAGDAVETVTVVMARRGTESSAPSTGTATAGAVGGGDEMRGAMVQLVRYAAQVDHAPPRLVSGVRGVSEVLTRLEDVSGLYGHPDQERLKLLVRGQWGAGNLFVTAVDAVNGSARPLPVDVRRLADASAGGLRNGVTDGLVAAAAVGGWTVLAPRGEPGSVRRMYLVTRRPADVALALE